MAISPNYSWPLPDDTDLVKNGAEAIRDLGNAIDNTVENLPSGALVHINTVLTGTGVASFSVDDVFSSIFDNYKILIYANGAGSNAFVGLRLRVGGSDSSVSYQSSIMTSPPFNNAWTNTQNTSQFRIGNVSNASYISIDLMAPFLTRSTGAITTGVGIQVQTQELAQSIGSGFHGPSTSFTGFTILNSVGNFNDAEISIYGYKK